MTTTLNESVVNAVSQEDKKMPLTTEAIRALADSVSYDDLHTQIKILLTDKGFTRPAMNFHVILNIAKNPAQNIQKYLDNVIVDLPNTYKTEQNGETVDNPKLSDMTINTEIQYGYPAVFFKHLCEPLRALYVRMNGERPYPNKPYQPVTKAKIYNLPLSVIRIIYYMANEDNILKFNTNKKNKYPFVVLEDNFRILLANIFLKMITSEYFNLLAPLYVFSLIPICSSEDIKQFNTTYPLNKINRNELSSKTFREKAANLKKTAIEYAKRGHQDIQSFEEDFSSDGANEQSNNSQQPQQLE